MADRREHEHTTQGRDRSPVGRFRNRRHQVVAAIAVVLLAGAYWFHREHTTPNHFQAVVPGVLYRSAWPTASQLDATVKRYGIRTVVNLCLPNEELSTQDGNWERELAQCKEMGVSVVHLPLPGNSPPSEAQAEEWLRLCTSAECQPVLVHCAQGVIRTNGMVAVYEIGVLGQDNRRVMASLPAFGHHLFKAKRRRLNEFILSWQPEARTAGLLPDENSVAELPKAATGE